MQRGHPSLAAREEDCMAKKQETRTLALLHPEEKGQQEYPFLYKLPLHQSNATKQSRATRWPTGQHVAAARAAFAPAA
eukprot:1150673-Pelagomonas_calceolata.AAC.6